MNIFFLSCFLSCKIYQFSANFSGALWHCLFCIPSVHQVLHKLYSSMKKCKVLVAGIISFLHKVKPKRPKHPMTQEEKSVSTQFGWKFVPPMLPLHFPPFSVPLGNPLLKWLLPACFMLRCPHNYTHLMTSVNKIINWHLKSSWKIDKYNFSWRKPQLFSFTKRRTCWINPFRWCTRVSLAVRKSLHGRWEKWINGRFRRF